MPTTSASARLFVHLPSFLNAGVHRLRWESGLESDRSPYGFHHAEDLGYSVTFSTAPLGGGRLRRRVAAEVRRITWNLDLLHAWRNRRSIRRSQIVWTMLEQEALAISLLMLLRLIPRRPIIAGSVWMLNDWNDFSPWRRQMLRRLVSRWSVLAVHAEPCLAIAEREVGTVNARLMHFGISEDGYRTTAPVDRLHDRIVIFAMGNDRTRDWQVLLLAFGNDSRFRLVMVCQWFTDEAAASYDNVQVVRDPTPSATRELYAASDYAAVPMHDNQYSGITVALEAAALGVPILGTRTGGLSTYFDEDEMLLAPVHDHVALRDAALRQTVQERREMAERAQRRYLCGDYTTSGMMKRYDHFSRKVLASGRNGSGS